MSAIIDAMLQSISLPTPPQRIVSLVPSISETICTLVSSDRLVGVTRFCNHPKHIMKTRSKIGGTKDPDILKICSLSPDIVLGNAEENTKEIFQQIRAQNLNLYVSFPKTVDEALQELLNIGILLHALPKAKAIHQRIQNLRNRNFPSFRYVYLIWDKPRMAISSDCFISSMLAEIGGVNLIENSDSRYPNISLEDLKELPLDCILLSSEPFPFKEKHRISLHKELGEARNIFQLIDGEYCSWHGVRMESALQYLHNWRMEQCF